MTEVHVHRGGVAQEPVGRSGRTRPRRGTRRFGYGLAVLINAALLYAVNAWPGWQAVPFLTSETRQVLGLVNASMIWTLLANVVYLVNDHHRLKAVGDAAGAVVAIAAMLRIWDVFPFQFGDSWVDWALVLRVLLVLGIVGGAIGVVANTVAFLRYGPRG